MSNLKSTNYGLFAAGLMLAFAVALAIIPGVDALAWLILKPVGYWQKLILIVLEVITFLPRVLVAFLAWVSIGKFFAHIS